MIRRYRLGAELRRLREGCSLRVEDAAAELGVATSTLSRIETGHAPARTSYVNTLLTLYGVADQAECRRLTDLAREGQRKGWWTAYEHLLPAGAGSFLGLEAASCLSRTFAVQTIPGVLQTSDYATAVCGAARPGMTRTDAGALAAVILRRQPALRDGHRLHVILDESALLTVIGSVTVMVAQLDHLRYVAVGQSVTVQVLPLSAPRTVLAPPFTLLSFPDPDDPDAACRRGADGQITLTTDSNRVAVIRDTFTALSRAALPPEASASLIGRLARQP